MHVINYKYSKGLSAPVICVLALVLTAGLALIEREERSVINDGTTIQINVEDSSSESLDSGSDDEGFDIPAEPEDEEANANITEEMIKETTLELSKIDFAKKVLWRIHRIDPLDGLSEDDKNTALFKAAVKLFAKGDYEKTYTLISKLPRKMRHKERPGFYYALALTKAHENERAIRAYQGQLERFPHHQASAINYGLLLLEAEKYREAVKAFKFAANITSGRRKAKSYRNLGSAYYELGKYEDAEERFSKSIEYQPTNSTTWLKLAEAQQQLPKYSQAEVLETYRKSIALAPNRYTPALERANYLFSELMFAKAAKDYTEARKRSGNLVATALMQSINYLAAGDLEAAEKALSKVRQADDDEEILIDLVKALSNEQYDEAEDIIDDIEKEKNFDNEALFEYLRLKLAVIQNDEKLFKKFDKDVFEDKILGWPSQLEYARGLFQQEKYKEAESISTQIIQTLPNSAEAHLIHGQVQLKNGNETPGFNSLKHAYNIYPKSRRVAFIYAKELQQFDRSQRAISVIDKMIKEHPKDIEAFELKARIHRKLGQNDLARQAYTAAFELDDKNIHSAFALAELENDLGNKQQSLTVLKDLLERDSSYIDARELRAEILCESRNYKECMVESENILGLDKDNKKAKALIDKYQDKVVKEDVAADDKSESEEKADDQKKSSKNNKTKQSDEEEKNDDDGDEAEDEDEDEDKSGSDDD